MASKISTLCLLAAGMAFNGSVLPAPDAKNTTTRAEIDYPPCTDYRGMSVNYMPMDDLRKAGSHNIRVAFAAHSGTGVPYTVFHEPTLKSAPVVFQRFVLAHECEHHKNGDVARHSTASPGEADLMEKGADCGALRTLGYGRREIEIIAATHDRLNPPVKIHGGSISWEKPDRRKILNDCLMNP